MASFEIVSKLGSGGMGIVYRARDLKLEREVALKRPLPKLLERPDFRKRFMDEARSASQLKHPSITTVFEVFEEDGVPWLVMELIDGASLRSLIGGRYPIPVQDALRYAEELTDAVRVAHLGGVLHRDIKPSNVLVGSDGRAHLCDFGLAHARAGPEVVEPASEESTEAFVAGGVEGTRGYMSPEQALGKSLDPRSDIFLLGLVFYEMCTGRPAFAETQSGEWLDALLHREPLPISELNSEVPVEFQEVVRKAIAKRRFQRYQSANEMLLDVRAVRRKLESDTASGPAYHSQRRPGGWRWYALGGAAALVAAVGIGLSVLREPAASESSMGWRPRQITTSPGWEAEPALSPDGTMIAYTSNQSGNADIWLVDVHGGNPLPLTDHPAVDRDPTWFPDGSEIAFVSERGGQSAIWKMPRLGGSTVLLVPDAVDPAISWDGRFIAFSSPTASGRLRIGVAPTGDVSATRILTGERQGFWDHQDPAWSPDGRSLCFTDFRDLWLVSVDGRKPPHRLTTDHANDRDPAWSPDGRWIYFSSAREGTAALWRVPAEGGRPERQTLGTGPEGEPSTAHQGGRLAYSTYVASQDIAIIDRSTGALASIPGDRLEEGPAVSPDGTRVVFTSNRSGQYDLWRQELDAQRPVGAPTRLSDFEGSVATPSFSPDGAWIVFFRVVDGQRDIWLLPSDGGVPIQITSDPGADIHPSFSPDGSRIAFVSDRDGEFAVWIAPVSKGRRSGSARKLETHREAGAFLPAWSPDGARIAFVSQSEVWIAEVDRPGDAAPVTRGAGARVARWERSGDSLLVSGTWGTDRIELKDLSLTSGEASPLRNPVFQGKGDVPCFFSMSADGRIVAFVQSLENGNIWLVETGGEVR